MIHNLPSPKTVKPGKRKGRGYGSGKGGHTSTRGQKGQKSRSGYKKPGPLFEGGQNPINKRFPKLRGLTGNASRKRGYKTSKIDRQVVSTTDLNKLAKNGDKVTFEYLVENKLVNVRNSKKPSVKILLGEEVAKKLTVEGIAISKSAADSVTKAGGEVK